MGGTRAAIASGRFDDALLAAARRIARRASSTRPTPTGAPTWSPEDIDDVVFDTVARVTPAALVAAANQAATEAEFLSWVRRAIRTTLDMRARKSTSGRVIRSMDDALSEEPTRFRLLNGHWRLADDPRTPGWNAGIDSLVSEAWTVQTATVHLARGTKTPPFAARRDIRDVCEAVLRVAGPLPKGRLAEVLAYRFNVAFETVFEYLDIEQPDADHEPEVGPATEAVVDDEAAAEWMLGQLTGAERRVLELVVAGASLRDLTASLRCTVYEADKIKERLEGKLGRLARVGGDGEGATAALLRRVRQDAELWHSVDEDGESDAH